MNYKDDVCPFKDNANCLFANQNTNFKLDNVSAAPKVAKTSVVASLNGDCGEHYT